MYIGISYARSPVAGFKIFKDARAKVKFIQARIFSTCLEPQLISIAGIYRTSEVALPEAVQGKPAQVRLVGESLVMEPL